ncbi:MAG: hypothetical protein M3N07_06995, partial [Pseudomonadota bacterium]|nr:hypothetical protein [Pseudomonadota bacterium]
YLLSPASLVDRSLGRRVHLRRTSRATGEVREHEAVIRSGSGGALVLETEEGFEALRCTGLAETLVYPEVPEGLSAEPTLSVRTRSSRPARATVVLSYLASGFDWQANYVATLSPDGNRLDLLAWLTLASADETSFVDAQTQTVAGRLNSEPVRRMRREPAALRLRCWPEARTSDFAQAEEAIIVTGSRMARMAPPPPPPPPPAAPSPLVAMEAQQEELGDVKLYRIPQPVTVASNSQKQVAFLQRRGVRAEIVYRHAIHPGAQGLFPAQRVLVTRNRPSQGLGVPLPAGRLVLFAAGRERPILLGEGSLGDRAVGEEVEVELGPAPGVNARIVQSAPQAGGEVIVTVTNDRNVPVRYEATLPHLEVVSATRLGRRNGLPLWSVTVPANGEATLRYRPARER